MPSIIDLTDPEGEVRFAISEKEMSAILTMCEGRGITIQDLKDGGGNLVFDPEFADVDAEDTDQICLLLQKMRRPYDSTVSVIAPLTDAEVCRLIGVASKAVKNCPITLDTILRVIERAGEMSRVGRTTFPTSLVVETERDERWIVEQFI